MLKNTDLVSLFVFLCERLEKQNKKNRKIKDGLHSAVGSASVWKRPSARWKKYLSPT